jgi:uncharacterized 2Fe-2S/4Fe-4S cluster protein (DUF4445 family)
MDISAFLFIVYTSFMEHFSVTFLPDSKTVRIHAGATLFEAAGQADIVLVSPCGGRGTCKKCRVQIEPSGREVLACQFHIDQDITVTIPVTSRFYRHQILQDGMDKEIAACPSWRKVYLAACPSSVEALQQILTQQHYISIRSTVPTTIPVAQGITAVLHFVPSQKKWDIVSIEPDNTTGMLYGAAVDIGTTTVVLRLIDLITGKTLATTSAANPQHQWGDDVISRIQFASDPQGQQVLQHAIIDRLNHLLRQAVLQASISPESVYEVVAVGNTTMNHLLLKFPVEQLGQSPYLPHSVEAFDTPAVTFGLKINPAGFLHTPQNIAGFVGSDTLAAAVAADLDDEPQAALLVDIGTNGELVLCYQNKLYAASCAAGPALEGARVLHGSRAMDGAIQRVIINGSDIDIDVIGSVAPRSICGSGLIDALAVLVELGIIDSTGLFVDQNALSNRVSPAVVSRLVEMDGQVAFVLAYGQDKKPSVWLNQADVRHLQLAKAAILAGIRILEKNAGIDENQFDKLLLAGAFGNYIQKSSAVTIGLLPAMPLEKIHFIGNAASGGAMEILLDRNIRIQCESLARRIEYIELASRPDFQDIFMDCLMFG